LSAWLDFGDGFAAAIECSFDAPERQYLEFVGTEAAVRVDRAFTPCPDDTMFSLRRRDGRCEGVVSAGADPYQMMIEHFHARVREKVEPRGPIADTLAVLNVLERLREAARLPGS